MSFDEDRDALSRIIRRVFPRAKPVPRWQGVEAWGAPRPAEVVDADAPGTYDPALTVIGIADRKSGPTIYFLDPGDYFILDKHRATLEGAGLKLGRGCIYHTKKGPLPTAPLETMFRTVKARDARNARGKKPRRAAEKAPSAIAQSAREEAPGADGVETYLAALPAAQRAALERLRAQILSVVPNATQKMAYGIPTFVHAGKNLVHMAAFKEHCSFFPGSGGVTLALKEDLKGRKTGKGSIQFAPSAPLPAVLVKRIVRMRVAEVDAKISAKRSAKAAPKKPASRRSPTRMTRSRRLGP